MNILKWKREENLCNCKHRWMKNMEKFMYLFEKINRVYVKKSVKL
ncbi:Uncharacterised protein [Peptostreptococcus anaerobius]|uniref:Uncharacterized protein n=1 Tax=Peptostreptococcus anaerobius TaxID=1261 RepID=A0A379CHH9_9FIRM